MQAGPRPSATVAVNKEQGAAIELIKSSDS